MNFYPQSGVMSNAGSSSSRFFCKKGTRMYPTSRRNRTAVVLAVLFSIVVGPGRVYGHGAGGGGGHGGGGHGTGYHSSFSTNGRVAGFRTVSNWNAGATRTRLVVDSPGFPEDLPAARFHRFLEQHLPHPHWGHLLRGA